MFKTKKLCYRKVAHLTFEHAKIAAKKLKDQKKIIVIPYYCKHCKKFHTGKPRYHANNKIFWENIDIKMKNKNNGLNKYKELLRGDKKG